MTSSRPVTRAPPQCMKFAIIRRIAYFFLIHRRQLLQSLGHLGERILKGGHDVSLK